MITGAAQVSEQAIDAASVEKIIVNVDPQAVTADADHYSDVASIDLVQRRLKQRHVQMYIFIFRH